MLGWDKCPRDPRLVIEALDERAVMRALRWNVQADGLNGDRSLDQRIEGFVDRAHRAEADRLDDLITADFIRDLFSRSVQGDPPRARTLVRKLKKLDAQNNNGNCL